MSRRNEENFLDRYLQYTSGTESPMVFHRWCGIGIVATLLAKRAWLQHGHFTLYPNQYIMLIGVAGARKSTAVKIASSLLEDTGYDSFSADKSTKEKFLLDLAGETGGDSEPKSLIDQNLWGDDDDELLAEREMLINADEFNDFLGAGNLEFISLLGVLWDKKGIYENRIKNGRSVRINNPCINILSGNTPTTLATTFPQESMGQGFFSRLLFIHAKPSGKRIAFPRKPDAKEHAELVAYLARIKQTMLGEVTLSEDATALAEEIYEVHEPMSDGRFEAYNSRRFTHLLKLALVCAAMRCSTIIESCDIVEANTWLHYAEHFMPEALSEFGKARNTDAVVKVLAVLDSARAPMLPTDLWPHVAQDLDKVADLSAILHKLQLAGKIQFVPTGILSVKAAARDVNPKYVDLSYLTKEEVKLL